MCILWQSECGETTNCIVYSTVALRQVLMFTTAGIMFFGVVLDIGSWYYSKVNMATLALYWAAHPIVGRVFVCLPLELAS